MFLGKYSHNIDAKGRVIIPAKFREQLGDQFIIVNGLDGCLFVYPMEAWSEISANLSRLPSNQKGARHLQRAFQSGAAEAEPDKQGKVLITPSHRLHANLTKEVVIIGVGKRVEIWDAQRWQDYLDNEGEMTVEEAAESLEGISF